MTQKYSDQVLEETPGRAAKFLSGIGASPVIRTLLDGAGMTEAHIDEGSKLLVACWAQLPERKADRDTAEAKAQRAATAEIDQWDEPAFTRFGATLRRHYPSAADFVFQDLAASTGSASVAGAATFLTRLDVLEQGSDATRAASKVDDKKAVELLADRGLDTAERTRLGELVKVALQATTTLPPTGDEEVQRREARKAALTALKDWYEEWAATARAVVKKRGYLIRLGLASRKMSKKDKAGTAPPK